MLLIQQLINGLMLGSIFVLVAVSFTLTIGVLNFLNFSIPGIFMLGGFLAWAALVSGAHWSVAVVVAILSCGAASLLVERFTYRWMRESDPEVPLVSSLGFLILFENVVLVTWCYDLQAFPAIVGDFNLRAGSLVVGVAQLISLVAAISAIIGISYILNNTQLGRGIRVIAENPGTAETLGIEVKRIVPVLFIATGLIAGLGGVLFGMNYLQVTPFMGEDVGLKGIAAMVIGGMGSVWGAVIGGLLIGLTEVLSIHFFGANLVDVCVFGLLFVLLVLRPQGILGASGIGREKL